MCESGVQRARKAGVKGARHERAVDELVHDDVGHAAGGGKSAREGLHVRGLLQAGEWWRKTEGEMGLERWRLRGAEEGWGR